MTPDQDRLTPSGSWKAKILIRPRARRERVCSFPPSPSSSTLLPLIMEREASKSPARAPLSPLSRQLSGLSARIFGGRGGDDAASLAPSASSTVKIEGECVRLWFSRERRLAFGRDKTVSARE